MSISQEQQLGGYRLLEPLGQGGMGRVFLAIDPRGRAVACKVLNAIVAADPDARARLSREVALLERLDVPGVARVVDADLESSQPFLVTQYVPGENLSSLIGSGGWSNAAVLPVAEALADAIDGIHAAGVIHRDIKPSNVLLSEGLPVLIDFGIAHSVDSSRMTHTGLVMGTPGYLAPEVINGEPVSYSTDWWGWAATVTQLLTGRPPFGSGGMELVISRVMRWQPDTSGLTPVVESAVRASLHPDPRSRADAAEVIEALRAERAGASAIPRAPVVDRDPIVATSATEAVSISRDEPEPWWQQGQAVAATASPLAPAATTLLPAADSVLPAPASHHARISAPSSGGYRGEYEPSLGERDDYPHGITGDEFEDGADHYSELAGSPGVDAQARGPVDDRADPRASMPARSLTLAMLAIALCGIAASAPLLGIIVWLAWSVLTRSADSAMTGLLRRRHHKGVRASDAFVTALLSPANFAVAAVRTVTSSLLPLLVGVAAAVLSRALFGSTGAASAGAALAVSLGVLAMVLMNWWGPGGPSLRRGSRMAARRLFPGNTAVLVGALALVFVVAATALAAGGFGQLWWWPLGSSPWPASLGGP